MAIIRSIPRSRRMPSYRGEVMIDTCKGVLRVRKWPKKRGKPRSAAQRYWVDWFKQANLLAKYADGLTQARAIALTKGTGLYPRDIMLSAMRGRLYTWIDETGWQWYPMAAIQDISDSLDVLAQTIGSVLVRAADRWRSVVAGTIGDVLTYQGDAAPPSWVTPSVGVVQQELAESPIVPDGSVNNYVFDLSAYLDVDLILDGLVAPGSHSANVQFSTDGGITYHSNAADYFSFKLTSVLEQAALGPVIMVSDGSVSLPRFACVNFRNLRTGRTTWPGFVGTTISGSRAINGYTTFDGPITHMKLSGSLPDNWDGGVIRVYGSKAA